jgi:hypothetical protein
MIGRWTTEKGAAVPDQAGNSADPDPDLDEPVRHEMVALAQIVTIAALLYAIYC